MTNYEAQVIHGDEDPDGWREIDAYDHEEAATELADIEDCESADYEIVGGNSAVIWVRKMDKTDLKKFEVIGEAVPSYRATEL